MMNVVSPWRSRDHLTVSSVYEGPGRSSSIRETSTPEAPWYVIPADKKWFTRLAVAGALVHALERLKLEYPKVEGAALAALEQARAALKAEKD